MSCLKCGFDNVEGMNFCGQCGESLGRTSTELDTTHAFAPGEASIIGRYITHNVSDKTVSSSGKIEGQRRQVTALFADMEGYTSMSEAIGEEAVYQVMDSIYECMISSVYKEDGNVQKLTGDGMFALFGAPVALEDAPHRACRAAVAIQQGMQTLGEEIHASHGVRPRLRIGIHTGLVVLGSVGTNMKMEFTALGDTINLASRLESEAEPGGILISETAQKLTEAFVESTFAGKRKIKGKAAPQGVYKVLGLKKEAERFDAALHYGLTPFVGREEEMSELERYCDEAGGGRPLLVQVKGEAGIGKSRLIFELKKRLEEKRVYSLKTHCTAFGRATPFLPFVEIIRSLFRIEEGDNHGETERKCAEGLKALGMDAAFAGPFLMAFLGFEVGSETFKGMDAKLIGDRTREILVGIIRNKCELGAIVLVIEDLHWIDEASEELILQIVISEGKLPLLLLCAFRPEYKAPWEGLKVARDIHLQSLSRQSTIQMVCNLLGNEEVSDDIAETVIGKSECNPLFTEEITRYLLESGSIKREEKEEAYHLASEKVEIPTTIVDLLQSRVDSLPEGPKSLLQILSVIGRRFSPTLARWVSGLGDGFDRNLAELEKQDFVVRDQVENKVEYRFKHALIQDAIYENLLQPKREELHKAVGTTIEELYPDRYWEWAETLAHHWNNSSNTEKAIFFNNLAGKKSLRVYALDEAVEWFQKAATLIESSPEDFNKILADVTANWATVFHMRREYKDLINLAERFLPRIEASGDKKSLSLLLSALGNAHAFAGRGNIAKSILERAKTIGEEIGDQECIGHANCRLMMVNIFWNPDHEESDRMVAKYYKQAMACADNLNDVVLTTNILATSCTYASVRSRFGQSREHCYKLLELGKKERDSRATAFGLIFLAINSTHEDSYQEALDYAEESLRISEDPMNQIVAQINTGGALALTGRVQEGFEIVKKARNELLESEYLIPLTSTESSFGAIMVMMGKMEEGVRHIKKHMAYFISLGNYTQQAWGNMYLAMIYLKMAMGEVKPPLKVILKNLWFIIKNKPFAKQKARYHLSEVIRHARTFNMPGLLARSHYYLALLSKAEKKYEDARSSLNEALAFAQKTEPTTLTGRIQAELANIAELSAAQALL